MKSKSADKIKMPSIDELLGVSGEESATDIEISRIHSFVNHPFKVLDDDKMDDLVESIKQNGVLTPVLVRPDKNNSYEMISGHRRMHAAIKAGLETIPAIVRDMEDDEAIVIMVDANIQREELLPSEKAFASLPDYLDGPMTLIKGHTIYADNIDSISYYREHPLVLEAIQELRERFPDFKYFMTAQEKQDIYPEHMTAEAIAYALVDLAEDFDTYEFRDNVDDKETLVKEIEYDLYAGRGKKEYAGFLKDVMDESDELNTKAQVLLQRINDYSIPEKKDLEPMVKIVFSEYREMETGKYLPFKEANEKLGALDQTFLKENQASDKWDDLYSVGYMVLCSIDSEIHKVTGKIMLGTGEGDIIEHMKGIEDQRDVQEHILPYLYEYCGLVEKSPDIATEVNEKESAANHKEVQSEAVTVKSSDRSAGEKKKSIHDRLKENKEKLGQKSGKDNLQKGVELT